MASPATGAFRWGTKGRQVLLVAGLGIAVAGTIPGSASPQSRPEPRKEFVEGDTLYTVLPPGAIPAVDDPTFVSAGEAAAWMADEELVIGLVAPDGSARAYSAWHLDHHEIVNDRVGEVPIAATW